MAQTCSGSEEAIRGIIESLARIEGRMIQLERALANLIELQGVHHNAKDYYSTAEFAKAVGKAEYIVREWARHGRLYVLKRRCGRGKSAEWKFSHEELVRYRNEGLLPLKK